MELPILITRASVESEVESAVSKYHREQQGKTPENVRADLFRDTLFVRSSGILTPTEARLMHSEEGKSLVKSSRKELRTLTRRQIEAEITRLTGLDVLRSYWDLDVRIGEQIEVYILAENLEEKLA